MEAVIELKNIKKVFKNKTAVDGITFSIHKGEIVAILGPNGAGKTTTMNIMLGLMEPSEGSIQLFNKQPKDKFVREKVGAMLQEVSVIDGLKVREVIQLFRSYYPKPLSFEEIVAFTGFSQSELQKRANKLSGGQKRRLGFALAMTGNPDVLFFDEPTVGLDVTSRKVFWNTIKELKQRGKTILFTTHYLQEADDVAERVILFNEGNIVGDGTPKDIKSKLTKQAVSFEANPSIRQDELTCIPFVTEVYEKDGRVFVLTEQPDDVLKSIIVKNLPIRNIGIEKGRLEDAFEQVLEKKEVV
ncbi:ABC transporter ATP-binding protein [Bacillus sp. UMB0899]|nr:ABC transporter ATP-binding protein [Bacillus sp. UMB0899]